MREGERQEAPALHGKSLKQVAHMAPHSPQQSWENADSLDLGRRDSGLPKKQDDIFCLSVYSKDTLRL